MSNQLACFNEAGCIVKMDNGAACQYLRMLPDGSVPAWDNGPTLVAGPGRFEYTFSDGCGNETVIDVNEIDMDVNEIDITGTKVTFTAEDSTTWVFDVCDMVANYCNSTLVANADGTWTHTANNGDTETFGPFVASIVDNGDGSFTGSHTDGTDVTWTGAPSEVSQAVTSGHIVATHTSGNGVATDIIETITTISNLIASGNQIGSYKNEDGTVVDILETITALTNLLTTGHQIGTYTGEDGTTFNILETIIGFADLLSTGHTIATITDENGTQHTVREVITALTNLLTTGHQIGTYTGEDGTTFNILESVTAMTLAGNNVTYTSEDGTQTTFAAGAAETITAFSALLTAGNQIGIYTNESGTTFNVLETITELTNLLTTGNTIGVYTDENGATHVIRETITGIGGALGAGHSIGTYTSENGTTVTLRETITALSNLLAAGNVIGTYTNEDGTAANIRETVTTLVDNAANHTFTYTREDGTQTTVDYCDCPITIGAAAGGGSVALPVLPGNTLVFASVAPLLNAVSVDIEDGAAGAGNMVGGVYTIPKTCIYNLNGSVAITGNNGEKAIGGFLINGTPAGRYSAESIGALDVQPTGTIGGIQLPAGTTISLYAAADSPGMVATSAYLSVEQVEGAC